VNDNNDLFAELDQLGAAALGMPATFGRIPDGGDDRTVAMHLDRARAERSVDVLPAGETRLLGFKRRIMRLSQLFLNRQARYNAEMLEAVTLLNHQLAALRAQIANDLVQTSSMVAELDSSLADIEGRFAGADATASRLGEAIADIEGLQASHAALRVHANLIRSDLDRMVRDLRSSVPPEVGQETIEDLVADGSGRSDEFYERFEDKMRGTADAVRSRLEPYIADLEERRELGGLVIDIGCGRGEWLELLDANGFESLGIDTNEEAVARCTGRGLKAIVADAISHLRDKPTESVLAITAFHLIEHLPADKQLEVVEAALRALKPGGLLIVETPNPTNLNVGAASFYSDPTHLRPVSPDYLAFLLDDVGFVGVETRFLHPRDGYLDRAGEAVELDDELMWALRGPQDFAVVGRRPAWPTTPPA
jgi:SAM-dependent methyltransferase